MKKIPYLIILVAIIAVACDSAKEQFPYAWSLEYDNYDDCIGTTHIYELSRVSYLHQRYPVFVPIYIYDDSLSRELTKKSIREKIIEIGPFSDKIVGKRPSFVNSLMLTAIHEYPECSDFLLLNYEHFPAAISMNFAYVKSSERLYNFTCFDTDTLIETFNLMIQENPKLLGLEPICLARLILVLNVNRHFIYFLESENDLRIAYSLLEFDKYGITQELFFKAYKNILYFVDISNDTSLVKIYSEFDQGLEGNIENTEYIKALLDASDIEFGTKIIEQDKNIRVEATLYVQQNCDLSRWAVVFSEKDEIKSIERIQGPIQCGEWWNTYRYIGGPETCWPKMDSLK